ncbi:MAG: NVEALA domain-containing protein [Clostridium sp.]|nr:NVEALA domain-containing protein [Clostridium sp.]
MKQKLLIGAIAVVGIAISAFFGKNSLDHQNDLSEIQLANIEALSDNEIEVVSCRKENGSVCVIIVDGVVVKEYKNKTKDRRN